MINIENICLVLEGLIIFFLNDYDVKHIKMYVINIDKLYLGERNHIFKKTLKECLTMTYWSINVYYTVPMRTILGYRTKQISIYSNSILTIAINNLCFAENCYLIKYNLGTGFTNMSRAST